MRPNAVADAALGARLLDELDASQIPYAVLHGEAELSRGVLRSDVDLAVGAPIAEVVARLRQAAEKAGAGLVMVNPYDQGGLATFWLRRDWSGGVQIDLLRDVEGRSKLAFKTDVALRHVTRGQRWLTLAEPAEQAYLLSKRWLKGDVEALRLLHAQADPLLLEALTPRRAAAVRSQRTGSVTLVYQAMRNLPLLRSRLSPRGLRRMRHPVGSLIEVIGDDDSAGRLAELICDRLGSVGVTCGRVRGASSAARLRRSVSLRRPQILVTIEPLGRRPDLRVGADAGRDPSEALDHLWAEMVRLTEVRAEKQMRVHRFHS